MSDHLVEQLRDDIRTLIDNLTAPKNFETSRIRNVSSSICRRWLIDKGLVNLAHSLGVTPSLPAVVVREAVWDLVNGNHQGQQPCALRKQAGHTTASDRRSYQLKKCLAMQEPSTQDIRNNHEISC